MTVASTLVDWPSLVVGLVGGGLGWRLIELLIEWAKERRDQKSRKTAHEKDRARFRLDISMKNNSQNPALRDATVELLNLGQLPQTIQNGELFIQASHHHGKWACHQLDGKQVSSAHPLRFSFSLPPKLLEPSGIPRPLVEIICQFTYAENESFRDVKIYRNGLFG